MLEGAMSELTETVAKRLAKLFSLLGSSHDGEVLSAARAMKRLLESGRLSFPDIAIVIESCNGAIEERKYSDSDAEIIFARGVEKGRVEEERRQKPPPEFYDADGRPRYDQIALFCQANKDRLRPHIPGRFNEHEFVDDMAGKMTWQQPTERQAKVLISIFVKLGGHSEPN
jgi:hypothetical protein